MRRAKLYLANLLEAFPAAMVQAWRSAGWQGLLLAVENYLLRRLLLPVALPGMGRLHHCGEAANYLDNICLGELRCEPVEAHLRAAVAPTIIDLGVNVGITIRWWFTLNANARVVGVDMVDEALAFTTDALQRLGIGSERWTPLSCALGDATRAAVPLFFTDPLEGTTRLGVGAGPRRREVRVDTLDHVLATLPLPSIDLLKCDIEGAGGAALSGGLDTLARTRFVVAETHDPDETRRMTLVLTQAGFSLFRVWGRTFWWENPRLVQGPVLS